VAGRFHDHLLRDPSENPIGDRGVAKVLDDNVLDAGRIPDPPESSADVLDWLRVAGEHPGRNVGYLALLFAELREDRCKRSRYRYNPLIVLLGIPWPKPHDSAPFVNTVPLEVEKLGLPHGGVIEPDEHPL
jgi:hypothetical protein